MANPAPSVRSNFRTFSKNFARESRFTFLACRSGSTDPHDGLRRSHCTTSPQLKRSSIPTLDSPLLPWLCMNIPYPFLRCHEVLPWVGCHSVPPCSCQCLVPAQRLDTNQCQCCIIRCSRLSPMLLRFKLPLVVNWCTALRTLLLVTVPP